MRLIEVQRQRKAAHSVQMIEQYNVGYQRREGNYEPLAELATIPEDSSDDGQITEYDEEGASDPRPWRQRRTRTSRGERYWDRKMQGHKKRREERRREIDKRRDERLRRNPGERERRKDYLLLEYLENGSLASLIIRLSAERGQHIPNHVLWAFWLCCKWVLPMYMIAKL